MTETKLAIEIIAENEALTNENARLQAELTALQEEHSLVVITIIKTLSSLGLWPLKEGDNYMSKVMKSVKTIVTDSMLFPDKIATRFSFMKEIIPMCEKYKDIQV
jgi:hypothetical protein